MPLCKITPQATNRFCCLVIGQAGTGKTSLLRTIMGQEYDQESREWKQSREPTEKVLTLSAESGLLCVRDLVEQGMVEGYEIGSLQDFREAPGHAHDAGVPGTLRLDIHRLADGNFFPLCGGQCG